MVFNLNIVKGQNEFMRQGMHWEFVSAGAGQYDPTFNAHYCTKEGKTIESVVPFPAPEKEDNRVLSPFHPQIIIVIGECPLLSPV